MRKAQMEMLGLALIVILISVGMLFVIKFAILDQVPDHKQQYTESELASNFISTLLQTTNPGCRGLRYTELLQDVAEKSPFGPYMMCVPGYDTKTYLITNITAILNRTFDSRKITYNLSLIKNNQFNITPSFGKGCRGSKTQKEFAVPVGASGAETLFIKMDICS
ncbi:MAG: hypothetical protein ABIJ08_00510 [Nanoarchaeota archaeon]